MSGRSRTAVAVLVAALAVLATTLSACANSLHLIQPKPAAGSAPSVRTLSIGRAPIGRAIPAGFVGISIEFHGLESYAGFDPKAINPAFEQLLRNLSPGQRPVLRIGGDSTDWTWWPVPGVPKPGGIRLSLDRRWMAVAHAVAQDLNARMILGVNLEADSTRVAAGMAAAEVRNIGRRSIEAIEIGNEPELYPAFNWFRKPNGVGVKGRPPTYNPIAFQGDFTRVSHSILGVPLAGPSTGAVAWMDELSPFLTGERRVGLVTLHAYPLKACTPQDHPTDGQLLADSSSAGLAAGLAPFVHTAHAHGRPVRLDEMNGVTCGGYRGVSNTFASSLWVLDALFEMARLGFDGVNVHSAAHKLNELIAVQRVHGTWQIKVHPEYYGMLMFAQAAPPGARLLGRSWALAGGVKAWATRAPNGVLRVVLINKRLRGARTVRVRISGARGPAAIERLQAPSIHSTGGVTLGGQTFGAETTTGKLGSTRQSQTVKPSGGAYVVTVPAVSAAMLTIPASAAP